MKLIQHIFFQGFQHSEQIFEISPVFNSTPNTTRYKAVGIEKHITELVDDISMVAIEKHRTELVDDMDNRYRVIEKHPLPTWTTARTREPAGASCYRWVEMALTRGTAPSFFSFSLGDGARTVAPTGWWRWRRLRPGTGRSSSPSPSETATIDALVFLRMRMRASE
jgi:hypothetical protein